MLSLVLPGAEWKQGDGFRWFDVKLESDSSEGFEELDLANLGVEFTNQLSYKRVSYNHNLLNGAGVAAGDFDGDGLCDLYFCNLEGPNALFRNLGNWQFENVTEQAGVACEDQSSTGAVFGDLNGDDQLDLIVTSCGGPNACFFNQGNGQFNNVTEAVGLVAKTGSTSMALADVDGDSDLDLYIANYGANSILRTGGRLRFRTIAGEERVVGRYANRVRIIDGKLVEFGEPDAFYLNDGKGNFSKVSWGDGNFLDPLGNPLSESYWDLGLSVAFRDINQDGRPDIYVCNDFQTPDRIWLNQGNLQFQAMSSFAVRHTSHFSMSVDFADIDRNGVDDFFLADMLSRNHQLRMTQMGPETPEKYQVGVIDERPQIRMNTLFWNRGDSSWAEIAHFAGVHASDWTWCAAFMDVDLDGYEDLLVTNGHAYDTQDKDVQKVIRDLSPQSLKDSRDNIGRYPALKTPNFLFRNNGDLTFEERGRQWGYHSTQVSHGISLADLDLDGDQDVVVSCLNAPPLIYRNLTSRPRISVRLKGPPGNSQGIGSRVSLVSSTLVQSQEIQSGGRYLSGDDPMRVFAIPDESDSLEIEVIWADGRRTTIEDVQANRVYEVTYSHFKAPIAPIAADPKPLFRNGSSLLSHTHSENSFDDFSRQPLLPRQFSQPGPPVLWLDFNNDGFDDLFFGMDATGVADLKWYPNESGKRFRPQSLTVVDGITSAESVSILAFPTSTSGVRMLFGVSNYESLDTSVQSSVFEWMIQSSQIQKAGSVHQSRTMVGPMSAADIDADGDLDVFVGGRLIPGQYPESVDSALYHFENGNWILDTHQPEVWRNVGLVSGSTFTDLNSDGFPDLVLACEWGAIRVLLNQGGEFKDVTDAWGTLEHSGMWNGVTSGDIDGDGRLDILATNWGLNTQYGNHRDQPVVLHYSDVDQNGTTEILEAYISSTDGKQWPRRDMTAFAGSFPLVRQMASGHKSFGEKTIEELLSAYQGKLKNKVVQTFESMLFLNRGDRFEAVPLPMQAQWSPAFGVNIADFNGDGFEDVFLAQNFFAYGSKTPRSDAGLGLLLSGDGAGTLTAVASVESGIRIHGAQRSSGVADFNQDGRLDIAVTQNGTETQLLVNQLARPGLRIRTWFSKENSTGIGCVLRLEGQGLMGPARLVHAGSGFRSQSSAVQVMNLHNGIPERVHVLWPGGATTVHVIPQDSEELVLYSDGGVEKI